MPIAFLVSSLAVLAIPLAPPPGTAEHDAAIIRPGDTVRLVIDTGPVRIERKAVAIQAARNGQHLFVKTVEGDVIAVRAETAP